MSHVFHRRLDADYPIAVAGEGAWITDARGRRYLDGSSGAAVSCLGHDHPRVREALKAQVDRLAFAHTGFFTTEVAERLADHLIARAPAGLDKVYLVAGGSEAMEAALKLARQYWVERGAPGRARFVARRQSYHGNTLGALAVGGNAWRRAAFDPLLVDVAHVTPCYPYRERGADEDDTAFVARLARELDDTIAALGAETVIGFVAEPVVGATMGAVPAVPGYFRAIKEVLDRHGCLLILDEVMCGMGRTGTLFACEQEGVTPDLVTVAKGLGAGYAPIGAMLAHRRVVEAIRRGSGFFQHGHTYLGHAVACAAALAVQEAIEAEELLARVRALGARLAAGLDARFADHPHVGEVRGRGLFRGIELVADRSTKAPFDPARRLHARIKTEALGRGLMIYPMGGTIDGRRGDHVLIAPPFICSDAEIDAVVERLGDAVDAAIADPA